MCRLKQQKKTVRGATVSYGPWRHHFRLHTFLHVLQCFQRALTTYLPREAPPISWCCLRGRSLNTWAGAWYYLYFILLVYTVCVILFSFYSFIMFNGLLLVSLFSTNSWAVVSHTSLYLYWLILHLSYYLWGFTLSLNRCDRLLVLFCACDVCLTLCAAHCVSTWMSQINKVVLHRLDAQSPLKIIIIIKSSQNHTCCVDITIKTKRKQQTEMWWRFTVMFSLCLAADRRHRN